MERAGTILIALLLATAGVATPALADELPNDDEPIAGPGVSFDAGDSGPNVTLGETTEFRNTNPWTSDHEITLDPWGSVYSDGSTQITVDSFNGTETAVSDVDGMGSIVTIKPNDKPALGMGQQIDSLSYDDAIGGVDDGVVDWTYDAPGSATVRVRGVTADTDLAAVDPSTGAVLDAARSNASGYVTFDQLDSGSHDVQIQTYDSATPDARNLSPDGTSAESDPTSITLSADVVDGDFPDDVVDAEIVYDGSTVTSETFESNGTISTTISETTAGTHDWSVVLEDEFGNTRTVESEFLVASELSIYNESAPSELADNVTVDIEYYFRNSDGDEAIVTRNTSDGTINMTGLSATEPFVVVAEADGYVSRRIFVNNLSATQSVYLLPDQGEVTQNDFVIQDLTGRYPQEDTVLQIQRNLQSEWRTVHGDFFGADGSFPATLRYNVRHRLIVRNVETGRTRRLGTYTAQDSGEVMVTIRQGGDDDVSIGSPTIRIDPTTRTLLAGNETVTVSIDAADTEIEQWTAELIAQQDGQNTTLESITTSDGLRQEFDLNLTDYAEGRLFVDVTWNGSGSLSGRSSATYGISPNYDNDNSMLAILGSVPDLIPDANVEVFETFVWLILTVLLTIGFATTTRASTETVGLVGVSLIGAGSIINWVPYSLMFAVVVTFAALAALRRRI